MSQLDDIILELCPDGVEYQPLGELLEYEQPGKYLVSSTEYDVSYSTPVLTAGQTFILGYTNETSGIYPASIDEPVIIFDDFTTAFKWVDFPFKAKSSAMKMLRPKGAGSMSLRYLYYAMQAIRYRPQDHSRQWIGTYSKFMIPVPPAPVQDEVVRLLDELSSLGSALEGELNAELGAIKRLFAYHRDLLLTFANQDVQWRPLGDAAVNLDSQRKPVTKSARQPGSIPYYGASGIVDYVSDFIFDGDYLLISEDGANLLARSTPIAFSISGKTWINNHAHVLEFSTPAEQKFVEIYLNSIDLSPYVTGSAQPKLNQANLNRIPIPVVSPEEQERVIGILDRFSGLIQELSESLSTEVTARRSQYEHYLERLLTFKELAS